MNRTMARLSSEGAGEPISIIFSVVVATEPPSECATAIGRYNMRRAVPSATADESAQLVRTWVVTGWSAHGELIRRGEVRILVRSGHNRGSSTDEVSRHVKPFWRVVDQRHCQLAEEERGHGY